MANRSSGGSRRTRMMACAAVIAATWTGAWGCRGATQIHVDVHTDVPCTTPGSWQGVAIYSGAPGLDVESRAPVLTTTACDANGQVGSIVLVPSRADDDTVGVRVVAGITRPPEECAAHGYDGCIIARRTVTYLPHASVDLEIALTGGCIGRPCDPLRSCLDGVCQDARLTTTAPDPDAAPAGGSVRCGDDGLTCPAASSNGADGPVCCLEVANGVTHGRCIARHDCPATSTVLDCDDETDCAGKLAADGAPTLCCLSYTTRPAAGPWSPLQVTLSACRAFDACLQQGSDGLALCQNRRDCGSAACEGGDDASLPKYFWCRIGQP